ncbi:hypothetical protein E6H11_00515 [Candidatus Bathyarchaeota archaeon]|nr:MAG: hypothetical protein E6H11_00515 [Candidatus Bathyarchaeota archaeon]
MNVKISSWLAAVFVGLSIAGLTISMPTAHAEGHRLALDGMSVASQSVDCRVSTPTLSCATAIGLNTTHANDVVVLAMYADGMSVSQIIDKAGLSFTPRFEKASGLIAEYYAVALSVLTDDNTTVVFSGARHALTFAVTFAVSDANIRNAFDPSVGLPTDTTCPGLPILPSCDLNIPTKKVAEFVFTVTAIGDAPNCRTGFTNLFSNGWIEIDYTIPATKGTVTFSCSRIDGAEPAQIVGDAIFPHRSDSLPAS